MKKYSETFETCEFPHVSMLGDGVYSGTISGYIFKYKDKKYKCSFGIRGNNCPIKVIVKNGKDNWEY